MALGWPTAGSQNGNILRAKMDGAQKIQNSLHWEVDNYNGEKGVNRHFWILWLA